MGGQPLDLRRHGASRQRSRSRADGVHDARVRRIPSRVPALGERQLEDLPLGDLPPALRRDDLFAPQCVDIEFRADGSRIVRAREPLGPVARSANAALERGARSGAERTLLAEPAREDGTSGWRTLSYGAALRRARAIAQGLLDAGADRNRPVLIAARNGIPHALVTFAAQEIGVPTIPIAPSRLHDDASAHAADLATLVRRLRPAVAFADDAALGARVAALLPGTAVVTDVATLESTPTPTVARCARAVNARTVAKVMLTSGTTGAYKGVLTTHGMIVSNQVAFSQVWPLFDREPPVLVDWLPWSHAFGGTKVLNFALHRGGTLYVDDGLPTPGDFARTIAHLRDVAPTLYFNVPRGYALLVAALENDAALRATFFSRLRLAFSAAATLPPSLAKRFARLRANGSSRAVPLVAGWGLTETAPGATCVHQYAAAPNAIGVPLPGVEIKLAPVDGRDELRVRGPNVTPGYAGEADATRAAFDEEGFFRSGDAGRLVDDARPERGFTFAGRLAENFKLSTGVWVRATLLRDALLEAAAPLLADVLLTGDDADDVCAIVFLAPGACDDATTRAQLSRALSAAAAGATGPSGRIARALVASDPPSAAAGELTAKGTLNRAVALKRRSTDVSRLYPRHANDDPDLLWPAP